MKMKKKKSEHNGFETLFLAMSLPSSWSWSRAAFGLQPGQPTRA